MATSGHLFLNSGGTGTSDSLVMEDPSRIPITACGSHQIMSWFFFFERLKESLLWDERMKGKEQVNEINRIKFPLMFGGPGVTVALWEQWDLVLISHWHKQGGGLILLQYTTDWQLFTLDYDHSHYLWRHTNSVPQVRHVTVSRLLQLIMKKQCVVLFY